MKVIVGNYPGYLEEDVVAGHREAFLKVAGVQGVKVESTGKEHTLLISVARLPVGISPAFQSVVTRTELNLVSPPSLRTS